MRHYAINRADGGVSILCLTPGADAKVEIDRWTQSASPSWLPIAGYREIRPADLPSRRFRNAWRHQAGTVAVDITQAREQILREVREQRNRKLAASDAERLRLMDSSGSGHAEKLSLYRQSLRDLPALVSEELQGLTTEQDLEAYRPTWPTLGYTPPAGVLGE